MSDLNSKIKEQYGDVSLESAPIDPENPAFNSLLSALEAVHTGKADISLLEKYYTALSAQIRESRESLRAKKNDENADRVEIAIAAIELTDAMLDMVKNYIAKPTPENMAIAVSQLLQCMGFINNVSDIL